MNLSHRPARHVLEALKQALYTTPKSLTAQELALANRVCHCRKCGHYWLSKKKGIPRNCPVCRTYHWDTPLIDAIEAHASSAHTEHVTQPPTVDAPTTQPQTAKEDPCST
jgi:predicted Zn-ribbon and HTH transcriptional regulator